MAKQNEKPIFVIHVISLEWGCKFSNVITHSVPLSENLVKYVELYRGSRCTQARTSNTWRIESVVYNNTRTILSVQRIQILPTSAHPTNSTLY